MEEIAEKVQATLLETPPVELEPYVTRLEREGSGQTGQPELMDVDEEDEEGLMQDEFVTEAEYGAGKEGGVDDEAPEET